jgi:protein-tyrosine phosphatase
MIDLHSHLLPGLDDGPANEAGSLALAAEAYASGVRVMVATPHLREDFPRVDVTEIPARVATLQARLKADGIGLELVAGGEVDVLWAQAASDDALRAASYGGRGHDLLIETPYGELPGIFEDILFRIRVRGFRILLAHPERNPSFQHDPERLVKLVEGDMLVQLTASSVTGSGRAGKLARRLIADGHAHVIAGDLHRAGGNRSSISDAVAAVGGERAHWMVTAAPAAILAGLPLPPAPVIEERRRGGWLRRR